MCVIVCCQLCCIWRVLGTVPWRSLLRRTLDRRGQRGAPTPKIDVVAGMVDLVVRFAVDSLFSGNDATPQPSRIVVLLHCSDVGAARVGDLLAFAEIHVVPRFV